MDYIDVVVYEKKMVGDFLHSHCQFAVHHVGEVESLKRKLGQLPLMKEKKRKLFQVELANLQNVDWPLIKKQRKSMFHPVTGQDADMVIDELIEVYC